MSEIALLPKSLQALVRELSKLPSIGQKSALRLAYHLVHGDRGLVGTLAQALEQVDQDIKLCSECFFLTDSDRCSICSNSSRNSEVLCVVEKPVDVLALERFGEFRGLYHVLHGLWAPLRGMGPESMKLNELSQRLETLKPKEVILATCATVEGDATAMYISEIVASHGIKTSRLAQGLPKGGELEYADSVTLNHAFQGRTPIG